MRRVPEVGDCWLDAGIVPFSTLGYREDRAAWARWYPADLVIEMAAQVRLLTTEYGRGVDNLDARALAQANVRLQTIGRLASESAAELRQHLQ